MSTRFATVFDGHHPAAGPYFSAERERIADSGERTRVADYLRAGVPLLMTTERDVDRVDAGRGRRVPLGYRTDGDWVWSESLAYYVAEHGVAPEQPLYRHIRDRGYVCPEPDDEIADRALADLYDHLSLR